MPVENIEPQSPQGIVRAERLKTDEGESTAVDPHASVITFERSGAVRSVDIANQSMMFETQDGETTTPIRLSLAPDCRVLLNESDTLSGRRLTLADLQPGDQAVVTEDQQVTSIRRDPRAEIPAWFSPWNRNRSQSSCVGASKRRASSLAPIAK